MNAAVTDDDVGKTVVDAAGKELGIVANVDNGRAAVDPNPSIAEHVFASLGIEGEDEEDYVVTESMVESIDDEIVLQGTI
ncbi:PRC-barrel domain-containing protein [Natronorubrum sp. A-ect3]|uniref:PRC-barrel domain-containing protein n=1 Tax=Natronorubrum sp. A-ect3 TaxID=3242698 RepID=UPI00359DDAD5